jgi:hypothetical protein
MDPWYKVATPRKEVREGRSFNPDEFAIHLEQVIAKTAPEDYRDPRQFFARTCFTRALREHAGMVLRRLAGETANTAPVLTLITQFGGGKTHTLTALYHLVTSGPPAAEYSGVAHLLSEAGLKTVPGAKVAAFVGNAWDPQEGRETPWLDVAWQLAGEKGVKELGPAAKTTPPGTEALSRVFKAAEAPVLVLFDEVLNFLNRHRGLAEQFHAFIQNLTVATTGTTHGVAVISLPRSQVEMTDWDLTWQEKITRVVRRVAKDLIANDESEISEVVRRRLFENIGPEKVRQKIAKSFADCCFERRAQLPPEWTAVDSALTEGKAREYVRQRFEVCYPFHPATLSVFQRKWQSLPQYQQTRGTLAMLAQWIAWAYRTSFTEARREPLITLGSAPLYVADFRGVVLGQLGESRLVAAIDADIAGEQSHARALDADTKGALRNIHRRVGTTIFFESSGGQIDKVAHLPELRFALGEPGIDTTSIDNAALALENKAYYIRRIGTDGFMISHKATIKKVVSDRRASLDAESEIKPAMRSLIRKEFERGASLPLILFPEDGSAVPDTPKLTLIILDPDDEWTGDKTCLQRLADWTKQRGKTPRLYPGALVWCCKKPGRDLREKVEVWLAWKRVDKEVNEGTLKGDFDRADLAEIRTKVEEHKEIAKDEVWGGYRYVILADNHEPDGLKVIDLGAGHSSSSETLAGRIITALKSQALLNESVGAGYLERNWPPALKEAGAWPLSSLRQSFLNGSLTRLLDPDTTLRNKIVEFVAKGEFGLASGPKNGDYERVFFKEAIDPGEVVFDPGVVLLLKTKAAALRAKQEVATSTEPEPPPPFPPDTGIGPKKESEPSPSTEPTPRTLRLSGRVPPELWNRLGTKIIPKLRSSAELDIRVEIAVKVGSPLAANLEAELKQLLEDLGLQGDFTVN